MAVPAFSLLSGFFLAGHVDRPGWYRSAVSKRVRTLLVPFVIWSLIWVAYLFCRTVLSNAFCSRFVFTGFQRWMDSSAYLGLNPTQHPLLGPLWYVRGLLFLVVLCPVFVRMLSRCKWLVLVCALLACLFRPGYLDCAGNISYTLYFFFGFSGLFCFLVGISIRLGYIKMPGRALMIIIGCLGAGIICASNALSSMHFMGASDRIALVRALCEFNNVPFLFCLVWVLIPSRRWPSWLTSMSFPIYLVHWFVMNLHNHLFVDRIETFGQLFFKAGFMVLGSLGIVAILRLLPRKAYEVLFGGR